MSFHSQLTNPNQVHSPKGFPGALFNTYLYKHPNGSVAYVAREFMPTVLDIVDSTVAPPTTILGDIYIIDKASGTLDVDTITWTSGIDVEYVLNGSPDLSGYTAGDTAFFELAGNASNNGTFSIKAVDNILKKITIENALRTDATDDEASDSTCTLKITHSGWNRAPQNAYVMYNGVNWDIIPATHGMTAWVKEASKDVLYGLDQTDTWVVAGGGGGADGNGIYDGAGTVPAGTVATLTDYLRFNGLIGIGVTPSAESLELAGAILLGNAAGTANGTVRYTGSDIEGRKGGAWVSLTATAGADGNGIFDGGNDGGTVPTEYDITITDNINFSGGNINLDGEFFANVKHFKIPHQSVENAHLVYSALEGNENAVYFRGETKNGIIVLPSEWDWLVDESTITVQATGIGFWNMPYLKNIEEGCIELGNRFPFMPARAQFVVMGERRDVKKLKVVQHGK